MSDGPGLKRGEPVSTSVLGQAGASELLWCVFRVRRVSYPAARTLPSVEKAQQRPLGREAMAWGARSSMLQKRTSLRGKLEEHWRENQICTSSLHIFFSNFDRTKDLKRCRQPSCHTRIYFIMKSIHISVEPPMFRVVPWKPPQNSTLKCVSHYGTKTNRCRRRQEQTELECQKSVPTFFCFPSPAQL